MEKQKDGRLIAQKNEIRVLRALQRFGWLRTKDIALLCWTKWKNRPQEPFQVVPIEPRESALRMSQRTMKRLFQKRQVIAAKAPNGSIIYALSEAGVRILSHLGEYSHESRQTMAKQIRQHLQLKSAIDSHLKTDRPSHANQPKIEVLLSAMPD